MGIYLYHLPKSQAFCTRIKSIDFLMKRWAIRLLGNNLNLWDVTAPIWYYVTLSKIDWIFWWIESVPLLKRLKKRRFSLNIIIFVSFIEMTGFNVRFNPLLTNFKSGNQMMITKWTMAITHPVRWAVTLFISRRFINELHYCIVNPKSYK